MAKAICAVAQCDRLAVRRGWCFAHYRRSLDGRKMDTPLRLRGVPAADRFWQKVNKDGPIPEYRPDLGPCWLWMAGRTNGYGVFHSNPTAGQVVRAHRWLYEQTIGPVPAGWDLDHLCRVRHCVRPEHLEPVTRQENVARGMHPHSIAHQAGTCVKGHKVTAENVYFRRDRPGEWNCRVCRRERDRLK